MTAREEGRGRLGGREEGVVVQSLLDNAAPGALSRLHPSIASSAFQQQQEESSYPSPASACMVTHIPPVFPNPYCPSLSFHGRTAPFNTFSIGTAILSHTKHPG